MNLEVETVAALVALTGVANGDIYTVTSLSPIDDSVLYRTTNRFMFFSNITKLPSSPSYLFTGIGGHWVRLRDIP